jgi:aminomuconate-semialdehyde/2-hydroxymuconate-6-semialdehyde dehydrogenase
MKKILNYINGELMAPHAGNYLDNIEPATGLAYSLIPDSDAQDIDMAVAAAKAASAAWANMHYEKRAAIVEKIAVGIESRMEEFVIAESLDNGKPQWLARQVDIPRAVHNFRFFATGIQHFSSESHYMEGLGVNYTTRRPIGVVACIAPWNLPLYLFSWKIAPALVAGNCVVAKPTEVTPYTAYLLSEVCIAAGLPKGVLNIVHGLGSKIGDVISLHPDIKAISFTGGTSTGKRIASLAAPMFKKLSLELGGKNPTVIFADCNFDKMLKTVLRSSFENQGQICLCGSRIL